MFLSRELTPARRRDRVEPGFAIGLRSAPISADEASLLQPHQRRIQRAHVELQGAAGHLLKACGDRVAVQRPERIQRLEDQQVERALQNLSLGSWLTGHANDLSPRTLERQMKVRYGVVAKRPSGRGSPSPFGRNGGRAWWAHFEFTRINIEPIILRKRSRSCVSWARSSSARAGLVNPRR